MIQRLFIPCAALLLLLPGCDATRAAPTAPLPEFVTAALPSSPTPAPTHTPLPPTPAPTVAPISGATTSEVNVRADTSTASQSLGTIPAFSTIQVIGKDASGKWFRVIFNNGTGWARADFVQVNDPAQIPIVEAESGSGSDLRGVVLRGVNVRSGAGQDFASIGLLNENDVVAVLARNSSGAWLKVEFPPAPDGTGWVAAEFLQVEDISSVPEIPAAETAAPDLQTPPSTLSDNDSMSAPLARFSISPFAAGAVVFQGAVSSLDIEDWISVSSSSLEIVIKFSCRAGGVQLEVFQMDGARIECGGARKIHMEPDQARLLKISPVLPGDAALPVRYEIKILAVVQ